MALLGLPSASLLRNLCPSNSGRELRQWSSRWISGTSAALLKTALRTRLTDSRNRCRVEGGFLTVECFFGGLFGAGQRKGSEPPARPKFKYHDDITPPFPPGLLSNTFLEGKELRCCYKASVDGFGAMLFHKRCDFKGPCVIVGRTSTGMRVGAFTPEGYRSTDDYYDSFDAFLFYWPSSDDESGPIILRKVGGSGAALFDYARGGPQFGADGLLIGPPLSPVMGGFSGPETDSGQGQGQLTEARSRLGLSYEKRPDGKESLFGDDKKATMVEIEVFCCPAIADLY